MIENLIPWLQQGFKFAAFLALAALGELLIEKSGSLNLGTPGTMCVGAATDREQATSLWSDKEQDLVDGGDRYVVKFKVVEWVQNLLSLFR